MNRAELAAMTVPWADLWIDVEVAAELEGISLRSAQRRVAAGQYAWRDLDERAANGQSFRQVSVASLSQEGMAAYLATNPKELPAPPAPPAPLEVSPAIADRRPRGASVPMLPDGWVDTDALVRAGRQTEADILTERKAAVARVLMHVAAAERGGRGMAYQIAAIETGRPAETLRGWVRRFERGGEAALVPGYGASRGCYKAIPEPLQRAILASYRTQQKQTPMQIMCHTVHPWCVAHRRAAPDRTTVARFLRHEVIPAESVALREGKREWEERVMAKVTRSPNDLSPNDIWCADHRRFDFFVFGAEGRPVRPWLTLYIDICTADLTGWCIREKPNSQSVALALRAGILKRGAPKVLYHDNGKEFTANRFGGKEPMALMRLLAPQDADVAECDRWPALPPAEWEGDRARALSFFAAAGIERIINALPYSSWSKPIESIFRAFHHSWENLMPGFCGNSPTARPEKLKAEMRDGRLLHWQQFVDLFRKHGETWSQHHVCGDRPAPPNALYARTEAPLKRLHEASLDWLLLKSENRQVIPQGIEIGGVKFLDEALADYMLQTGQALYNPDDLTHIVFKPARQDGTVRLVVPAIPHADWFEFSEANKRVLAIRKAQRQQIHFVAASDRADANMDYIDPLGANRMALENARAARGRAAEAAATIGRDSDPQEKLRQGSLSPAARAEVTAAPDTTDAQALECARHTERAAASAAAERRREAAATAAAEIAAQAQRETAYRAGA